MLEESEVCKLSLLGERGIQVTFAKIEVEPRVIDELPSLISEDKQNEFCLVSRISCCNLPSGRVFFVDRK